MVAGGSGIFLSIVSSFVKWLCYFEFVHYDDTVRIVKCVKFDVSQLMF